MEFPEGSNAKASGNLTFLGAFFIFFSNKS
jgi:hypothetical protein